MIFIYLLQEWTLQVKMHSNKLIYFFKIISFLEGISYILLLFFAMPLKYLGNNEILVKILGWPHGILFVLYLYISFIIQIRLKKWKMKEFFIVIIASFIPFGTFYINKYCLD
jgi:integral membrane protein